MGREATRYKLGFPYCTKFCAIREKPTWNYYTLVMSEKFEEF